MESTSFSKIERQDEAGDVEAQLAMAKSLAGQGLFSRWVRRHG